MTNHTAPLPIGTHVRVLDRNEVGWVCKSTQYLVTVQLSTPRGPSRISRKPSEVEVV